MSAGMYVTTMAVINPPTRKLEDLWKPSGVRKNLDNFKKSAEANEVDVFVSHCWYDATFIKANSESKYWISKSRGISNAALVLKERKTFGTRNDILGWTFWLDLACINQTSQEAVLRSTERFEDYIRASRSLIVILTPDYFTRLWCIYEWVCFLRHHKVSNVVVELIDTDPSNDDNRMTPYFVDSLRTLSVENARATFEGDRKLLVGKVKQNFKSIETFERFARYSAIVMICTTLFEHSAAVRTKAAHDVHILPWIELSENLGFQTLHATLIEISSEALKNAAVLGWPAYFSFIHALCQEKLDPLVEAEYHVAV